MGLLVCHLKLLVCHLFLGLQAEHVNGLAATICKIRVVNSTYCQIFHQVSKQTINKDFRHGTGLELRYINTFLDLLRGAEWMIRGASTSFRFQTAPFGRCHSGCAAVGCVAIHCPLVATHLRECEHRVSQML